MAKKEDGRPDRVDREKAYHERFADTMIKALEAGTAPWQKPWKRGEQVMPQNGLTGRSYRGGNAIYLAVEGASRGYADPRWAGYQQIKDAGGHVRAGEKGTPVMYVDFNRRVVDRDEKGQPRLDAEGHSKYITERRDRPVVKVQYVFNVEQTEGLKLPSLERTPPSWQETHKRAEAVMRNSGVEIKNQSGDRAYYQPPADRVVLPEKSQFPSSRSYYMTALHELGHATGHEKRLNRPTLNNHGGFGSETYAREELRAEMAAMMTGEKLQIGHEPRHGTAYVASWVKVLKEDPREIRAAAVDAQRASDWLVERERVREVAPKQPGAEPTKSAESAPEHVAGRGVPRPTPEIAPPPAPEVEMSR